MNSFYVRLSFFIYVEEKKLKLSEVTVKEIFLILFYKFYNLPEVVAF